MRRRPRPRPTTAAAVAALALGAALAGQLAPAAAAQQPPPARARPHHPEITGIVTCAARVNFGVLSWVGVGDDPATSNSERDESRTTAQVAISFSVDGGRTFTELPLDPKHRLDKSNGFAFTGSFQLASPLPRTVILRARAASAWADGAGLGDTKQFGPVLVPHCAGAVPPAPTAGFTGVAKVAATRPTAEFEPGAVVAAAAAMLVLLAAGLWVRRRVSRV
jgi:hypothetical protein